jgi:hypothetical protein
MAIIPHAPIGGTPVSRVHTASFYSEENASYQRLHEILKPLRQVFAAPFFVCCLCAPPL